MLGSGLKHLGYDGGSALAKTGIAKVSYQNSDQAHIEASLLYLVAIPSPHQAPKNLYKT